jgi:hypothetical protein
MDTKNTPILPHLLTGGQVARWLLVSTRCVAQMARAGELPSVLLPNGDVMFEPSALLAWLEGRRRPVVKKGGDDAA